MDPTPAATAAPRVALNDVWLEVRFPEPQRCLSWAIVGGGLRTAAAVVWHQVRDGDLGVDTDAADLLRTRLRERGLGRAVGLLTSAPLREYVEATGERDGVRAGCIATVGMSNALRAGDPPGLGAGAGTINLLVWISAPMTRAAQIEALALAAEARTVAVLEADVPSTRSGRPASGTGTDCIVVACPPAGAPLAYAGKHTVAGHLIGATVEEVVRRGIQRWRARVAVP